MKLKESTLLIEERIGIEQHGTVKYLYQNLQQILNKNLNNKKAFQEINQQKPRADQEYKK